MTYTFHPHAEKELEEIESYYDVIRRDLGDQFREDFKSTISRIVKFPNGWHPLNKTDRSCRLSRFPYCIIYRIASKGIYIVAVMHEHRSSDYWTYRT